jgi:hypothetical protein
MKRGNDHLIAENEMKSQKKNDEFNCIEDEIGNALYSFKPLTGHVYILYNLKIDIM